MNAGIRRPVTRPADRIARGLLGFALIAGVYWSAFQGA